MAFYVNFGVVNKPRNSTKQGTHGVSLVCELKEECSVAEPSLFIDISESALFASGTLNHCWIPEFNRYYFVDNWTYERGLWRADCSVDVMASYKEEIETSTQYILRCSQTFDGSIMDSIYPTKNIIDQRHVGLNPGYNAGRYVVGVISDQGGIGCVNYYAMNPTDFNAFCSYLFGGNYMNMQDILQDISAETWKSLYNPFQYVVSCMYFPVPVPAPSSEMIHVGYWDIGLFGWVLGQTTDLLSGSISMASPVHPNISRGSYVHCNPYTELELTWLPFGHFVLPPDIFYDRGVFEWDIHVDYITGSATLYIGGTGDPVIAVTAQLAVPIQLAQMSRDYLNMTTQAISTAGNIVSSAVQGDVGGAISNAASGIDSTVRSTVPRMQTSGSNGSFANINSWPTLQWRFRELVDEDNAHLGRPLCQTVQIASLGAGYIMTEGAKVDTPGTAQESDQVQAIMNAGFYYE